MISKLLIVDVNVSDEVKSLLEVLKEDSVLITYYDYSEGFIANEQNLLVDKLLALIRSHLETTTVNFEHLCFINVEQMNTPMHSFKYNNQAHMISGIESKPEELESWNFMGKLVADIAKTTEIRNIDFIDIDHLCFPKEHALIFDKIQEVTKDVEERTINYLKVAEDDKETIYNSDNWLHAMMTNFYSDENKALLDKYFKVNNSNIGFLNTKTMKPRDLQIYESHVPSIDFESDSEINASIIPLHGYENDTDYALMKDFIQHLNGITIVEFVYITDTMEDFTTRLTSKINKYCGENKDKINKVNVGFWLNPNVDNPALMLSNHISANIDQELLEVVNQLMTNNAENVDQLKNHFIVKTSEAFIDIFNMNVYDNMDVNTINFEIFNISDTFNTNYNLLCQFLHNDYFISTLVNFNLTFLSSSDSTENLFELHNKIEEFDEHGIVIDVSHNLFKDSQLMTDISNSEAYQDDLFITNISHINKSIQYNNSVNMALYLKSDGPEIDKFMKPNIITNVILYDRELREHLADVRECLLPNTLLLTFDKQNTYQEIKDGLLEINKLNGVQISNVALLQDNDSRSKTYNFVNEETCIVKYTSLNDPSLNTWSKFQDFVSFLDSELNVKHFDLMMCKIYSNSNWNYVIDSISSNLSSSLEIRSSENNTGHTMFEGDWILESPVVDVNMINLYFKESIKELDIQLGTNVNVSDYTKVGWMKTSHRFVHNKSNNWGAGSGPLFAIRCYTRNSNDYSFTSEAPKQNNQAYTIHFDNNTSVLVSATGWSNSYNYSDTQSEPNFVQKKHSQSPGNLYIAFDDESNVDENTWFIPVTAIWNGMNHGTDNLTAFSHTDFWDATDLAGHASLFGTFSPTSTDTIPNGGSNMGQHPYAYFYVGPYTAYSGIPNPVPVPTPSEGMVFPKLTDSDSNEISGNLYVSGGKTYISYEITSTSTINLSHDLKNVDIFIVAGGGGGSGGGAGQGGGAGGVVVATGIDSITSGEHTITVGEGGAKGTSASSWASESGANSEAFGYIAIGGGRGGGTNSNGANGGSGGGNDGWPNHVYGRSVGYHSDTETFEFTGGSANYNNDSITYPNVMIYGYNGGGSSQNAWNGTSAGGGGAGGAGGTGTNSNYHSGAGGVGMTNNFLNGVDKYYAGGGGGGNLHVGYNEGAGGNGGGGAGGNVPNSGSYSIVGIDGTPNTGGGGGGASAGNGGSGANGGSGGSGVVIFRFVLAENENLPAVSETDDFSTKFYNYNTGEALASTEEQIVIGSYEPKILDSNGDELAHNTYTENSIEYKSYVFTTVGTTSVSLSHDTPVDFMVVAGGGGGYSSGAGLYGGAGGGGVVVGTSYTFSSGNYDITVGDGGHAGPLTQAEHTEVVLGTNVINIENANNTDNTYAMAYGTVWNTQNGGMNGEDSSITGSGLTFKALKGAGSIGPYVGNSGGSSSGAYKLNMSINSDLPRAYDDNGNLFTFETQTNYSNDSTKYSNVIVYGNKGGLGNTSYGWAGSGGGGAGSVGGTVSGTPGTNGDGNSVGGKGGDGLANTFVDGTTQYYGAGGAGVAGSASFGPNSHGPGLGGTPIGVDAPANSGAGGSGQIRSAMPGASSDSTSAGGSGIVVIRFPKVVNEYETKKINVFTESTTAYLNYDISVAEIKKYVAPAEPVVEEVSTDISSQIVSLDAGVYNIVVDSSNLMDVSLAEIESGLASYTNLVSGASSTNFTTDWSQHGLESITNISSGGPDGEDVTRLELSAYNISSGTYNNGASYTDKNNAGVYYYGVGTDGLSNDPTTSMYLIVRSTPGYGTQQIHLQHGRFGYLGNGPHTITEEWGLISDTDTSTGHGSGTKRWFGIGPVENEHIYIDVVKIWIFEDTVSYTLPLLPPNITVDLSTNTITSNVDFEIKYTPIDLSLSELTKDTTINPVRSQTVPFVKSNGNQEERSVTLHGDATYNRFENEYYFPGDLSGYASIEGQLFGEHAMSMSFMYKSGGEQPVLETNDASMVRNTIAYIGQPYPSPLNQNAHDTNDFAVYSSPNDQASIFYKEDDTSIKEVPTTTFDNSSNYTHIAITMNEDLTLNETNGFKLYVDGTLTKSGNLSANNGALISGVTQPLQLLGKGPLAGSSQSSAFKGYLKNVRFYDHVLSQNQVSTIYTNMITNEYTDNKNFVSQVVPNLVISSSDISSGDHTELTSISMDITATPDSSLNITSSDINVTNGAISNFTNDTTNTWSFTFTPTSSNIRSTLSISENSLLDNIVNNMTDKPSWFTTNNNHASNVFEFLRTNVEMDLMPPIQDQTIAMITSNGSHLEIPVTLGGHTTTTSEQSIASITTNNTIVNIPDATSLDSIDISEGYVQGSYQGTEAFTGVYKVPDTYQWIIYYTDNNQKMVLVEAVETNGSIGIKTVGQGYVPTSSNPDIDMTSYNNRTSVTSEQYGLKNIVVKVANTVFAVTYDASKNEYDISENGYLSIDEDIIRDGDLTISLMYAMRNGNQYGNDQLVNFSDTNSLNTSTDSTDIHIFRDGTTPGAWFYYGSPDDNGMAISEAGLEPSIQDISSSSIVNYTHMAITVKEGQVKRFYINGEVVDYVNKYRSNAIPVSRPIVGGKRQYQLFGYGYAANRGFSGLMKNIRIYNKALTAYEVRHLYAINSNFNDNDFSNTILIPVPRPSLTFSSPLSESKILDSNGSEMAFNSFVKNGKQYKAYSFTNTGTTSITLDRDATEVEILIVGGGGAGGHIVGGGGGGGGVVYTVNQTVSAGTYNIVVGDGGQGQIFSDGYSLANNGQDSYISDSNGNVVSMGMGGVTQELKGLGGGGGSVQDHAVHPTGAGNDGGSGGGAGGAAWNAGNGTYYENPPPGGISTQLDTFYDVSTETYIKGGSDGLTYPSRASGSLVRWPKGGGGGGMGPANDDGSVYAGHDGDDGIYVDIGTGIVVAAGGGGAQYSHHTTVHHASDVNYGKGGSGIGGDGVVYDANNGQNVYWGVDDGSQFYERGIPTSGLDGTGSGGGGWALQQKYNGNYYPAGSGGSGIVIIQFPKPELASGSSLEQSTLDLTLTASDDGLDGNITASDIITSNGTITAFSQTSPITWDLTFTSDYNKQENVGSLFIEQDTIYNNDVSDAFAPEPTFRHVVLYKAQPASDFGSTDWWIHIIQIREVRCIMNDGTNAIVSSNGTSAVFSTNFTHNNTTASAWTEDITGYVSGSDIRTADRMNNGSTTDLGGSVSTPNGGNSQASQFPVHWIATMPSDRNVNDIDFIDFYNARTGSSMWRAAGFQILLLDSDLKIVASSSVTSTASSVYTFNLSELNVQEIDFTPPSWWTREHNKASNRFEWTALNSAASDTSTTPTRPSITFSSPDLNHGESQNFGTISMTVYVSSNNLNITQADLSFSNGVVSDFTKVANNYYTFNFKSASVAQPSIIEILQDTVSNAETSNDFNEASNTFEWTWGFTVAAPDVTITSSDVTHGGNFGGQQVNMMLEFSSEGLHGNSVESTFSQFDVSATNGYVFDISIISQSQIGFKLGSNSFTEPTSVFIPQNIISRTFNDIYTVNSNNTSNVFTWSYDSADLTISSLVVNDANGNTISAGDNINGNELWLQFTFSESIYNFDKSYFNVTNCKITNISTDTTFTAFTIKTETYFPTSAIIELQSNKLITTGRGLQKYITGSTNLSFNWNYDNTRPKISMTSSQASGLTNNVSFVDLSFVSTMDTSDFTESSILVTGDASLSNFTAISATEYSVRVTPNGVTSINITVPENAYTEQYGNGNENEVSFDWTYDNVPPTVEIFSPDIANGASSSDPYINIYFTISKPVDDFVLSDDANVANGTLGAMTKTNTFVNHTTSFTVTVASKTASHPYQPSSESSGSGYYLNGVESPSIDFIVGQTYTFDQSDSTNSTHPLRFYTTAEKDQIYTSGVVYTDNAGTSGAITTITIDENTPSPLYYQCLNHGYMGFKGEVSKKESYTAKLYPTQNDTVSIFIFAGSITDSAGNTNATDSNEFDWIFDSNDLLTTLSSSDVTNNGTFASDSITLSLATTAAIVDFVEADISYENGTISNVDSSAKTFTITSNAQGVPTTAFIIGGAVETSLGEPNIESNLFTWTYNPPIPKLVITSSQINEGDYTNISTIDFTLTFDQTNVVFDQNSLTVYNGTISSFSGSGTTYQVSVDTSAATDDVIRLTLPQGGAHVVDNGTHENDVSYDFEWYYDSIAPAVTIGSSILSDGDVTNLTSLSLTVTSSETIDGLSLSDFDVSNAVVSNLSSSSGTSFTLTIQPLDDTTDCSINIFLKDDSVTDRASNTNSQSNTFAFSYEFFSRKQDSGTIADIFENDAEIPAEDRLSSSDIDLVISAAFTIPDTASPFAVAATENSNAGGNNNNNNSNNDTDDNNDTDNTTTRNPTFVKPPKITIPPAIKIKNRKVFTKLIDQIFATASESVKTLTIDKSSVAVTAAAEEQIADVEEVVMVKSNQTEPVDMSTLVEDPTKPSATYIPLANVGDFAVIAIDGVTYTTVVDGEGIFALSSNDGGVIANPGNVDGKWRTNDVYQATDINKIIFGSQIISTDPVAPEPPTLTITSGQVSSGGTTDISYIDLSFVFSTTVEISLNSIEPLNADTTIISRTIESIDSSNSYISVTAAPVDASANNTIGVFVDVSAFYDTNNTFNDVQYTYSWNYSLDGGGSGTGQFVPCFLEGTQILTTNGYKNIELLDPKKDKLLDKDNKPLNFLDIQKYSQENNGKQYPYKIPCGSELSAEYICNRDLYLTYNHCVYLPHLNKYAPVSAMKHLKEDRTMTQKKFTYYHIFTENYFSDTLMANGIPCESHSKYTFEKLRNIDPSCKLLKNVIKKAEMLPNCMRNHLSIKETKQIIKKFKSKQSKQNKKKTKQMKKK